MRGGKLMRKNKQIRKLFKDAKRDKPYALYQVGLLYAEGKRCEQNLPLAAEYMRLAALYGYGPAYEWISDYLFDDDAGVQADS